MISSKQLSQKSLPPLLDIDFLTNSRGRSKRLQILINKYGGGSSYKSSNTYKKIKLTQYQQNVSNMKYQNNVIWIDNYCKFYKLSTPNINTGPFTSRLWCAVGMISSNTNIDLKTSLPCIPYDEPFKEFYTNIEDLLNESLLGLENYFDSSTCSSIGVHWVPISPEPIVNPHTGSYNMDNFYPIDLLDYNLSSDIGFASSLKYLTNQYLNDSEQCLPVVVDIGIFWRYNKWCYNTNNDMSFFTSKMSVWLGFWHTYKELCLNIWGCGLRTLFAPLLHHLWPDQSVFFKPKLGILETYFTWCTLAYPSIREQLQDIFHKTKPKKNKKPSLKHILVQNIYFFFESAIPFVCIF